MLRLGLKFRAFIGQSLATARQFLRLARIVRLPQIAPFKLVCVDVIRLVLGVVAVGFDIGGVFVICRFIALAFNVGAYNAEVVRAGIQAIPKGQWEAAWSLGFSAADTMRFVILPQALRIVVPPLVNNVVALLKDSSLASVITLLELALSGQRIISATFRPVEVYLAVAAVYLLLTTLLTFFTNLLERRLALPGR